MTAQGGQAPTLDELHQLFWGESSATSASRTMLWAHIADLHARASMNTPTGQVAGVAKDRWLAEETRRVMGLSHGNVLREWTDRTGGTIGPDNEVSIQTMRGKLMRLAIVEDAARAPAIPPSWPSPAPGSTPIAMLVRELDAAVRENIAYVRSDGAFPNPTTRYQKAIEEITRALSAGRVAPSEQIAWDASGPPTKEERNRK